MSEKTTVTLERRDARHFPGLTELRVERREDGTPRIAGTAIVFGRESEDLGGFREVVSPEVKVHFTRDLVSLFNHDSNMLLGRTPRTLRYQQTREGVTYEVEPPETQAARDVVALIERGDVSGNSFQFRTMKDRWERREDGSELRTLLEIEVGEMGPVVFPAYPQTDVSIAMRSREAFHEGERPGLSEAERRERELSLL